MAESASSLNVLHSGRLNPQRHPSDGLCERALPAIKGHSIALLPGRSCVQFTPIAVAR